MSADFAQIDSDTIRYQADKARAAAQWQLALDFYSRLENANSNSALLLNQAICHFALGDYSRSYDLSLTACKLQDSMWQARLILAKSAKSLGRKAEWVVVMQALFEKHSQVPEVVLEYASVVMNVYGHAVAARNLVKPYVKDPVHAEAANCIYLMTLLYDRPKAVSAKTLTSQIRSFARKYLFVTEEDRARFSQDRQLAVESLPAILPKAAREQGRRRVGFISGLFTASPVYFLAISSIRKVVEQGHQVVILSRSAKSDWATAELKALASEWIDCSAWDAPVLEAVIQALDLDELFEMAGWTDLEVLKALASKPARVQLKWIGGQSCTTGMSCFDGFITDDYQTPRETFELYTEPLMSLGKRYVQYTPPPYMPEPRERPNGLTLKKIQGLGKGTLGVIANPLKISSDFLSALARSLEVLPEGVKLVFIDQRYTYKPAQARISKALGQRYEGRVTYSTPADHPAFLAAMNEVDMILDTFPYSGGLTVCEALHLKIPVHVFPHDRRLFCERHVLSHLQVQG